MLFKSKKTPTSTEEVLKPRPLKQVRTKFSKILSAYCPSTKKPYLIRLDRKASESIWSMAYTFPFREEMKDEISETTSEKLLLRVDTCCPFCHCNNFCFCNECGMVFDEAGVGGFHTCPRCQKTNEYFTRNTLDVITSEGF